MHNLMARSANPAAAFCGDLSAYIAPDLWSIAARGNWESQNKAGAVAAEKLIEEMRDDWNPTKLGHVINAMFNKGRFGGVEVGFMHAIALAVIRPE